MPEIGTRAWYRLIAHGASELGIDMSNDQLEQLGRHAQELLTWGRKINLTAITEPQQMAEKHYLDCIAVTPLLEGNERLLDMGSGGGFPGIPLKILLPGLRITMIDASRKKVNFLKNCIRTLKLNHTEALHCRAQELSVTGCYREAFTVVVCRALTELTEFIQMGRPLVRSGGRLLALKGKCPQKEMQAARRLLVSPEYTSRYGSDRPRIVVRPYRLPYSQAERAVISVNLAVGPNAR